MHTTGTDVKHVPNAVAVLTLGKDMNFRDYAQGAYRMRGIATGQRINVLVVPEIEKVMHRELDALGSEGNAEFERMGADKRLLEGVACWLISNSLETECKACNFLMQQDLASLYRRHSLKFLLHRIKHEDFGKDPQYGDEQIGAHLESFREQLSLDVLDSVKVPRTFADSLHEIRDEPSHYKFILEGKGEKRMDRIFARLKEMSAASEGGLSQEQEQEQEEERETESANLPDDRPVIFSDIAFSRSEERAPPWKLEVLASEAKAADAFYPASEFGVPGPLGKTLQLPPFVQMSDGFFRRQWEGPRRIKNVVMLMEWIPSQAGFEMGHGGGAAAAPTAAEAQVFDRLWQLFSNALGLVTPDAVEVILACALHVPVSADTLAELMAGSEGAKSGAELHTLLTSPRLTSAHRGRHFVAVSLREAETLRALIHQRRRRPLLAESLQSDARIALRCVAREGALLDASYQMPDLRNAQMKTACQANE